MIYKLRADRDKYLNFFIDPYDIELIMGDYFLLGQPAWAGFWKSVNATFYKDSDHGSALLVPDVTVWGTSNCLALNQKAYEALRVDLHPFGEFLQVASEGIPYWVFHSTLQTDLEFVDETKSKRIIDEVDYVEMQSLVFNEKLLDKKLIFQTEFSNYRNMYCTEEFKSRVESNDLKGLYFSTDLACINEP